MEKTDIQTKKIPMSRQNIECRLYWINRSILRPIESKVKLEISVESDIFRSDIACSFGLILLCRCNGNNEIAKVFRQHKRFEQQIRLPH